MKNSVFILLVLLAAGLARAKVFYVQPPADPSTASITIDHNCVDLSAIPEIHLAPAASLRVLVRHASVGQGIDWGLECLAGNRPTNPSCCDYPPGTYDRSNWVLELRGGNSRDKVDDLVTQAATRTDDFDVLTMKFCYIDALGDNHPDWDYFRTKTEQLELDYPDKVFVWWTIPLTRDGMPGTDVFNALVRSYCRANGKVLFDIADIECHDPNDLKHTNSQGCEVICQDYTKEIHAGHLNVPGRIRVASALWHLMARIAGWHKGSIQAAIDHANDGDEIVVNPGTYTGPGNRDIDFLGKAITVRSIDPNDPNIVATTIMDCQGTQTHPHRGFKFVSNEDADSVLAGLTITCGYAPLEEYEGEHGPVSCTAGGAIFCDDSSPTITHCNIIGNYAASFRVSHGLLVTYYPGEGGGIFNFRGSPRIRDCNIAGNTAQGSPWPEAGGCAGGICSIRGNPAITGCTINNNRAEGYSNPPWATAIGGGILCYATDRAIISGCTITKNYASVGGGISCSNCTIDGCTLTQNAANTAGGIACKGDTTISNCLISGNTALGGRTEDGVSGRSAGGGGIYYYIDSDEAGYLTISHCVVTGNRAIGGDATSGYGGDARGGAIYCVSYSAAWAHSVIIHNSTISGNLAKGGSASVYAKRGKAYGGAICCRPANLLAHNSILWANSAQFGPEIAALANDDDTSHITLSYSDFEGSDANTYTEQGCSVDLDTGTMALDPCFAGPGFYEVVYMDHSKFEVWVDGDYHLKSQAGRWDPNSGAWVIDDVTSHCIDAGDQLDPIGQEPFPNGGVINMGAYGGTAEASKSYFAKPSCAKIFAGDINGDCVVDFRDFFFIALHWLTDNN